MLLAWVSTAVANVEPTEAQAAGASATPAEPQRAPWYDWSNSPFIPIPEIDVSPQSGVTLGVIPTFLETNASGEIDRIVAPDVIYSQYFGWGARGRVFGYPSDDVEWSIVGGLKQRVEREVDARYSEGQSRASRISWSFAAVYDRSGTPRFFGLGNQSHGADETSYLDDQGFLQGAIGVNITRNLQLSYLARLRYVDVGPGVLEFVPSIEQLFPSTRGIGSEHELLNRFALSYDSRDSATIPRRGAYLALYGGFASRAVASSVSYTFLGGDARYLWPISDGVTVATHLALRLMPSAGDAPFWALSSLGGDRSVLAEREPLRAFMPDRFIDANLFAGGLELRMRAASFRAFSATIDLEFAPFVDFGKVSPSIGENLMSHLHTGGGFGLRALATPYVVGYVDVGYGAEGVALFTGLKYPF